MDNVVRVICSKKKGKIYSIKKNFRFIKKLRDREDIDIVYISFFSYECLQKKNSNFRKWDLDTVLKDGENIVGILYSKCTGRVCCVDGSYTYKNCYWNGKNRFGNNLGMIYLTNPDYNEIIRKDFHVKKWKVFENKGKRYVRVST